MLLIGLPMDWVHYSQTQTTDDGSIQHSTERDGWDITAAMWQEFFPSSQSLESTVVQRARVPVSIKTYKFKETHFGGHETPPIVLPVSRDFHRDQQAGTAMFCLGYVMYSLLVYR